MSPMGNQQVQKDRILIVEDDPWASQTLRRTLQSRGYQTEIVPEGAEAVIRLHLAQFAAIIVALRLTRSAGLDLLQEIRQLESFRPWVIYTGVPEHTAQDGLLERGVFCILIQDSRGEDLLRDAEAACHAAERWRWARCA